MIPIFAVLYTIGLPDTPLFLYLRLSYIIAGLLILKLKEPYLKESPYQAGWWSIFLIFSFYILLGGFYGNPTTGSLWSMQYLYFALIPAAILYLIREDAIKKIFQWVLVVCVALSLFSIPYLTGGFIMTRFSIGQATINFARFYALGVLLALFYGLSRKKLYFFALALLLFLFLVLTGTRGALVSLLVAFIFFVLFFWKGKKLARLGVTVGILALMFLVLLLAPGLGKYRILLTSVVNTSVQQRLYMWQDAINVFFANPVFGAGTGGFGKNMSQFFVNAYPHNIFLEIGSEHGIIGLAFFLLMLFMVIKYGIRLYRASGVNRQFVGLIFSLLVFSLSNAMFSGNLAGNSPVFLFSALIANIYRRHLAK